MTDKIHKWHEGIQVKKRGEFHNDSDFVNIISSPNEFSDDECSESIDEDSQEPQLEFESSIITSKMMKNSRTNLKTQSFTKNRGY